MVKYSESNCYNVVFDEIVYICDFCQKSLTVSSMDDLKDFDNVFDVQIGNNDFSSLCCWDCSPNIKPVDIDIYNSL